MPRIRAPLDTAAGLAAAFGDRPFVVAEAFAAGWTRGQLRAAVARGGVRRLGRGLLVVEPAGVAEAVGLAGSAEWAGRSGPGPGLVTLGRVRAAVAATDGRTAPSHASAVLVHGVTQPALHPADLPTVVDLTGTGGAVSGSRPEEGWRRWRRDLPPHHLTEVDGLAVTTLARTAIDVACTRPLPEALMVVDAVLRRLVLADAGWGGDAGADPSSDPWSGSWPDPWVDPSWERAVVRTAAAVEPQRGLLRRTAREAGPIWGIAAARRAVELADPAAENGFESCSRGVLLLAGLPRPEVGYPVTGDDGRRYWSDLGWPHVRLLGEADGSHKYADARALYAEKRRQESLERAGWVFVRWGWEDVAYDRAGLCRRVLLAHARAADRVASGSAVARAAVPHSARAS